MSQRPRVCEVLKIFLLRSFTLDDGDVSTIDVIIGSAIHRIIVVVANAAAIRTCRYMMTVTAAAVLNLMANQVSWLRSCCLY